MSYKTILVCLSTSEAAKQILPTACNIARQFDAHLIGIHTLPSIIVYPGIAMHIDPPQFHDFNVRMDNQNKIIQKIFEEHVSKEVFLSEWRSLPAQDANASAQLIHSAYRADLVIVAKSDADADRFDQSNLQKDLILNSGRPVLMVPPNHGDKPIGSQILLAWNATRQASSAAHDSLPFLKSAEQVNVLTIGQTNGQSQGIDTEGHELSANLARHGVKPEVIHVDQTRDNMGEEVSFQAHINGCNLIVMGAFGHSRPHSMFFGDATRHMLGNADLPVLFSG
jgi:nucleotide-binding universal stress UspA family protein